MNKRYIAGIVVLSVMLCSASPSKAGVPDPMIENAVVTVYTASPSGEQLYRGTGFVVDRSGIIATNFHVISQKYRDKESPLLVLMKDRALFARLLSWDVSNDIALLKVEAKGLDSLKFNRTERPRRGEKITVIGYLSGQGLTESHGVVNNILGMNELIQVTAPIIHGSSGSPVLNSRGKVIGIATFVIEGEETLNFALPIRHVERLLERLKKAN